MKARYIIEATTRDGMDFTMNDAPSREDAERQAEHTAAAIERTGRTNIVRIRVIRTKPAPVETTKTLDICKN